ncbi:hypothetical protein [Kocuria sp. NPDC057446]|uniref:hypothetical protein n=1 Tax=Kocuria sp. NPDC057446 TaxID=3346137 RepID=UPI0036950C3B
MTGEVASFPPAFSCSHPHQGTGQPPMLVDMYPVGPWLFWISPAVLAVTTVFAVVARRRSRS